MIDEVQLRQWWEIEKCNGKLTEIRLISPDGKIGSGYFKNIDNIISEIKKYPDYCAYYTINAINEDCYGRVQCEQIVMRPKATTQDKEIRGRDMVVIDLDPIRASQTNSSDEELAYAKQKGNDIYKWLLEQGMYPALCNESGNGVHLSLRCSMKNTDENTETIKKFLGVIDMLFSDDKVDVDTSLSNSGRVLKCKGVTSNKGTNNPAAGRPQRMCRYTYIPEDWYDNINPNEYFEKVAAMYPETEQPTRYNNYNPSGFDLDNFIQEHNIQIEKTVQTGKLTKYLLSECPFCKSKSPDSALFKMPNGALGFRCLHNRCQHQDFKSFRLYYDPNSYSKKEYGEYLHKQRYYGSFGREPFKPKPENEKDGRKWLSGQDVKRVDIDELTRFNTGYFELDKAMWGLFLGDLTIVSGTSGSGKSSWLNCVLLNLVQANVKVAVWSGELVAWKLFAWLDCAAAGKNYTKKKFGYDNWYYAPQPISEKINNWLKRNLIVYNNQYGNNFAQLFSDVKECIEKEKREVVVIDNLAALDLSEYGGHELERQTNFITDLKNLAQSMNIHIIVVAHPRKLGQEMAVKESVSGNNNLTNLADNVIIVNRRGIDFQKRFAAYLGEQEAQKYEQYDTILHLAKSRMSGIQDKFFGLFFEPESRRIKNSVAEYVVYGWIEEPQQMVLPDDGTDIEDANVEYAPQQEPTYKIEKGYTPDAIADFDPFEPLDNSEEVPF